MGDRSPRLTRRNLWIGGGFTGLSAAYYLRQVLPTAEIVVLEAAHCGNEASARNGCPRLPHACAPRDCRSRRGPGPR